jgi:long-chain fatty acid transport protein
MKLKRHVLALALSSLVTPASVWATNGYFSHGYGMKAKGMAGAATATASDTFGGANNPASMVWVGNRMDLGADVFSPRRETSRSGGFVPGAQDSEDNYFLIPEFGFNRMIRPDLSLGVTVYGNGGMNTDYPVGTYTCVNPGPPPTPYPGNPLCGTTDLGVDLMQLMVAPTLAYKINEQHSVGISPILAVQRFSAYGLDAFSTISSDPNNLTNRGNDYSTGWGVRIGWMGKFTDKVTVGAAYSTKMYMDEFDKYKGLFAEQGDFDIPSSWSLGIAVQATPQVRLALDYQRINYEDVKSVSNPSTGLGGPLGAANGPGFGWQNIDVWKLGVEYAYSKNLTLRAGWNHGDNPIGAADVTFNILAPGVVKDHLTLGFTYTLPNGSELTMAYMHAFKEKVTGPNGFFGGNDTIQMYQNALGLAYSWKM